mgnify:CR=1 FL=1
MSDNLETYLQGPEPLSSDDYTSLQRRALGEVLRLSSEAVSPVESRVEQDRTEAGEQIKQRFDADKAKIEADLHARSRKNELQRDTVVEKAEAEYARQVEVIEADAKKELSELEQRAAALQSKAEREWQDKDLVADFVVDGAAENIQKQVVEAKNAVQKTNCYLDSIAEQADGWMRLYRQSVTDADSEHKSVNAAAAHTGDCRRQIRLAEQHLDALSRLRTARLFVGPYPYFLAVGIFVTVIALAAVPYLLSVPGLPSILVAGLSAAGATIVLIVAGGYLLWTMASRQARKIHGELRSAIATARAALAHQHKRALQQLEQKYKSSVGQKRAELQEANESLEAARMTIGQRRSALRREIEDQRQKSLARVKQQRDGALSQAKQQYEQQGSAIEQQSQKALAEIQKRFDEEMEACEKQYLARREPLEERWDKSLVCVRKLLGRAAELDSHMPGSWDHLLAESWRPPKTSPVGVRFGRVQLDLHSLSESVLARAGSELSPDGSVSVPAMLEFPDRCSMLLQYEREGRQQAIEALRAVMMRLFTSLPPGRINFTIIDPVALGESFAGFMHAADYLKALVGGRIWTETPQIQHELEAITQHMENVIQKYLRNEFETIEQYNEQAGELAEPYHFLVIADFPVNFNEESAKRLSSIINSGARCGVHTLIAYDTRGELPPGVDIKDISAKSIHLVYEKGTYVWQDNVMKRFPLALDRPPAEEMLTNIMHTVGKAGAEAARVEIAFEAVAPDEKQLWSLRSDRELRVPLGRTGATQLQYMSLGRGVEQHMLIAGKTGSGKSTLLHVMMTNLALWYSPDEVEIYMIDFKQGVEFKTYVTHDLPHARAVAIESDREFGLSILRRLDGEMVRRGDMFREAGVQDIAAYRQATGKALPRTVLVVDEFQIFFSEDDKLAQDAAILLEQLVRQGRAFGIHVVLGSQTLGGVFGLARSTIGQMAVRIALQCSEADSQLILDDDNVAARALARPGEAIYNNVGGQIVGNSPFQTAWLPDSSRDSYLTRVVELAREKQISRERLIVFEGSVPADVRDNHLLAASLNRDRSAGDVETPAIWLGAPVTIKDHTAALLRRQSGANVLIIGQRDEAAMNLMTVAMVSLAAQLSGKSARFVIMDGSSPDSPHAGVLERVGSVLPHDCRIVDWRGVAEAIAELHAEANRRVEADEHNAPAIFLLIYGLQRYRMLRRSEDDFGLSLDEDAQQSPDVQFAGLLREGPVVGIHTITWADTLSTVERTVDRQTVREFDYRVLFQMSAGDSSNLIDSPIANQLGYHRALLYSEAQGGMEKFRPYAPLDEQWLSKVGKKLAR